MSVLLFEKPTNIAACCRGSSPSQCAAVLENLVEIVKLGDNY